MIPGRIGVAGCERAIRRRMMARATTLQELLVAAARNTGIPVEELMLQPVWVIRLLADADRG